MSPRSKTATTKKTPIKVFISYSHKDSRFRDELLNMLASLENQKVIKVWQDRQIEAGINWYRAIQSAMKTCNMAILLVSQSFLNSEFIQREEVSLLLKQRMRQGMRVVPIIVRPCLWQDDPVLSKIQALPREGKPVISFSNAHGRRDQVWVEIAQSIGRRARALQRNQ
jgi:hypothetical protein